MIRSVCLWVSLSVLLTACDAPDGASASAAVNTDTHKDEHTSEPSKTASQPTVPASESGELPDFSQYTDVKAKKQAFFSYLLPMIQTANNAVLNERSAVMSWMDEQQVPASDQATLASLVTKYRVDAESEQEQLKQLEHKVNAIPPSLVLAQAANESAWGTSRFARLGNNLFGQWCFSKGCGIVPNARNTGASHEVAKFASPAESIASYIRNLNSHPTYQVLRDARHEQLAQQSYATGHHIAEGLVNYSERGEEYVKEIRAMIRFNKLEQFDTP